MGYFEEENYNNRSKNIKKLKFGTSGIRDEDDKLTDLEIYIATKGFLDYLFSISKFDGGINKGDIVALAGDLRPSTERIMIAVSYAILESGCSIDFCGKISTPAVTLWGFYNKIPSIMVTASHNPLGQNGLKFAKPNREILKNEENLISEEIKIIRDTEYKISLEKSLFDERGFFKNLDEITGYKQKQLLNNSMQKIKNSPINNHAKEHYINRYKNIFQNSLKGEKILFFEHTAVSRDIVPEILANMGAEVIKIGRRDEKKEFIVVDTENMNPNILQQMAEHAVDNNCSIALTTDGDGDRPVFLFIKKDKSGNYKYKDGKPEFYFIKGDKLNVLTSLFIKPDFVSLAVSVTEGHIKLLKKYGIEVKLTKLGSSNVLKALIDKLKSNENSIVYGFEYSGGGILGSRIYFNNLPLEPLLTRDSVLPIVSVLILAKKNRVYIEELLKDIFSGEFEKHNHTGLIENLPNVSVTEGCERYNSEIGQNLVRFFSPKDEHVFEIDYKNPITVYDEHYNIISIKKEHLEHSIFIKEILYKYLRELIGISDFYIEKINFLEGLRIHLSNGEFIYIRASGNACQFRCYAEAKTEERANELVNRAISPNRGVLVKLINDFIDNRMPVYKNSADPI